uniref:Uncharacterized protein n=1 Tax=Strigamia maritima TaxID=126957 RepID=T1JF79_STRMM
MTFYFSFSKCLPLCLCPPSQLLIVYHYSQKCHISTFPRLYKTCLFGTPTNTALWFCMSTITALLIHWTTRCRQSNGAVIYEPSAWIQHDKTDGKVLATDIQKTPPSLVQSHVSGLCLCDP